MIYAIIDFVKDHSAFEGPPPLGHPLGRPHLLSEVMRTSQALVSVFSRQVGMPVSRLALLRLVAVAQPAGIGVMELARELGINAAAVTRQVKELEAQRLVAKKADPRDARRSSVLPTAKGMRAFLELHERGHELERSLRGGVSDEEITVAVRVLGRLRAAIEQLR